MRENNNVDKKIQEEFHTLVNLDGKEWEVETNEDTQLSEESNLIYEKEDEETKLKSKAKSSNKRRWMISVLVMLIVTTAAFFTANWYKHSSQELELNSDETYADGEYVDNAEEETEKVTKKKTENVENISDYNTGDLIEFGSYPQSRVTDANLLSTLDSQTKTWKSYGYYSGMDDCGTMVQGDWMKYADVTYNGSEYRAVTFSQYRPYWTGSSSSANLTFQNDNGYTTKAVYWFKYEPIKWRVLDHASGLVMCESIIDSQPYSNTIYKYSGEYYNDSSYTNYANDYATSSIRAWLNDDFYNTAFSSSQKSQIAVTECNNSCCDSYYPQYNSETTYDKIFLLSYDEVKNSSYGFSSSVSDYDSARWAQGTDYAKCQGLLINTSASFYGGESLWWQRSPNGSSIYACEVYSVGYAYGSYYVYNANGGVRPALRLNLKSSISKSPNKATKG